MLNRRLLVGIVATILFVACSSATTTTTVVDAPASTEAPAEPDDPGSVGSMSDMPAECVAAMRTYLRAIEPIVEGVDFESLSQTELEELTDQLTTSSEGFEEDTAACPDLDASTEESFAIMKEFAQSEAPGTVAYFEFIEGFLDDFGGAVESASGDCETDIAAFQVFVDRGGSMSDLTASEITTASGLMSSIAVACSDERFLQWQEEVSEWVSG